MVKTVSIGVCAYNEAHRMDDLFESIQSQPLPETVVLKEILVVASGCTDGTDVNVEEHAKMDPRVALIREPERRGKRSEERRVGKEGRSRWSTDHLNKY